MGKSFAVSHAPMVGPMAPWAAHRPRWRNGAAAAATTVRNDAYLRIFDIFEVHAPRRPAWRWGAYRDTGLFVCLSYEREGAASSSSVWQKKI